MTPRGAAQGDTADASELLTGYAANGTVSGVALVNGTFVTNTSAARIIGVCTCNTTAPNRVLGVGFAGPTCSIPCVTCRKVRST